jgi:hypothetical protein
MTLDEAIKLIKSLHWFPGFMLGSCLYIFFSIRRDAKKEKHEKKKHSDFLKKYFDKEKE